MARLDMPVAADLNICAKRVSMQAFALFSASKTGPADKEKRRAVDCIGVCGHSVSSCSSCRPRFGTFLATGNCGAAVQGSGAGGGGSLMIVVAVGVGFDSLQL